MNKKLIRLAKLLDKLAPDECITSISVCKTMKGHKSTLELRITHFNPNVPCGEDECIGNDKSVIDGVEVTRVFFDKVKDDE